MRQAVGAEAQQHERIEIAENIVLHHRQHRPGAMPHSDRGEPGEIASNPAQHGVQCLGHHRCRQGITIIGPCRIADARRVDAHDDMPCRDHGAGKIEARHGEIAAVDPAAGDAEQQAAGARKHRRCPHLIGHCTGKGAADRDGKTLCHRPMIAPATPEHMNTVSTFLTWFAAVPRSCRTPSVMLFMPWI